MTKLFIMCGLPFSGKTFLAKKIAEKLGATYVGFDQLWVEHEQELPKEGDEGWKYVRQLAQDMIREELLVGQNVVYDDINVGLDHRAELVEVAKQAKASAVVVYANTPKEIREQRMEANLTSKDRHDVEVENLKTANEQFQEPAYPEVIMMYSPDKDFDKWLQDLDRFDEKSIEGRLPTLS